MKRLMMLMLVALAVPATAFAATSGESAGTTCTPTGFECDGIDLTAAQIGGKVTGDLDAAGCDIGVYYGPGTKGSVKNATIENAKYFGVVNFGGKVNVTNSTISQIGNAPFDGTQHGVGIFFTTEETPGVAASVTAKGTIKGNILHSYQKGGITVRGAHASATIEHNTLTGVGHVDFIAQNGIQVSFGGSATVKGNTVSGHWYTPDSTEACGLLFYQAGKVNAKANTLFDNEVASYVTP
jgi:parallel beta helix pectate lyase-like protein